MRLFVIEYECRRVYRECPDRLRSRYLWSGGYGFYNAHRFFPTGGRNESFRCVSRRMIADITETSVADMFPAAIFEAQVHALRRGRAMNDDKRNGSHRSMQELKPNTPASAVATATIDLRMMPHTDLDFVLM